MGNFKATLQLLAKGNITIQKHLIYAKINACYTSKTIQNDITLFQDKGAPLKTKQGEQFTNTIIGDEVTDPHSNCEKAAVCLRYVDLTTSKYPHINECLISFSEFGESKCFYYLQKNN